MNLLIVPLMTYVSACIVGENLGGENDGSLNKECNNAGTCVEGRRLDYCLCCSPYIEGESNNCAQNWVCDVNNPTIECYTFQGSDCTQVLNYYYANIGFRAEDFNDQPSDLTCSTDPQERHDNATYGYLSLDLSNQVNYIAANRGWPGYIKWLLQCDSCSEEYPCTLGIESPTPVTAGLTFVFQADFNQFYDYNCYDEFFFFSWESASPCAANYDNGVSAYNKWSEVVDGTAFLYEFQALLESNPSEANEYLGLGWTNTHVIASGNDVYSNSLFEVFITTAPTYAPTPDPTESPTASPTEYPTENPTPTPTVAPTVSPTQTPTNECGPYNNNIEDLQFVGVGSNCRAGLDNSYPGGLSCDSPYIVCLPSENTPAFFANESYLSPTHRYSVDECLQECANDQRCLGTEFVADEDSSLGDCNLIDDIPLEITSMVNGFDYEATNPYTNLDSSITNGDALCFEKKDACYPYFQADDLREVMLNCYCPNNRKGFYTKKVKRTVENTRFCGDDPDTDEMIRKAQANRMFHLCENWCLFHTEHPTEEYWFWDPWKTCFREQGVNSYCNQTIESPITIEMQFITNRRDHFCQLG